MTSITQVDVADLTGNAASFANFNYLLPAVEGMMSEYLCQTVGAVSTLTKTLAVTGQTVRVGFYKSGSLTVATESGTPVDYTEVSVTTGNPYEIRLNPPSQSSSDSSPASSWAAEWIAQLRSGRGASRFPVIQVSGTWDSTSLPTDLKLAMSWLVLRLGTNGILDQEVGSKSITNFSMSAKSSSPSNLKDWFLENFEPQIRRYSLCAFYDTDMEGLVESQSSGSMLRVYFQWLLNNL